MLVIITSIKIVIHHPTINTSVSVHLSNSLIGGIASS
jgi:hypothetical protein